MMINQYEELRYQVSTVNYNTVTRMTRKTEFYTNDFFEATAEAQKCLNDYHHVELFDSVACRILFDSSDLD